MNVSITNPPNSAGLEEDNLADAGDRIDAAARSMIRLRVCWVMHWLSESGKEVPDSSETVHQLRVWSRRTLAALHAYAGILPRTERKWFQKQMNRIRRAAGDARDLDVLLENCKTKKGKHGKRIRRQFMKERCHAQRPIWQLHQKLIKKRQLQTRLDRMLRAIPVDSDSSLANQSLREWAEQQIMQSTEGILSATPTDFSSFRQLHQLRIQAKQMRYTLELFAYLLPENRTQHLAEVVEDIQNRLGRINDHVVLGRRLQRLRSHPPRSSHAKKIKTMARLERKTAKKLRDQFIRKWPKMDATLRLHLHEHGVKSRSDSGAANGPCSTNSQLPTD
ncbi:CHAD domain protein [Rubripirellula lacrimiformis]|uniref:CHAD domain protein n=1 Tax=Rubripirellula lacrimiformis TaxID=1930273 RepID=A0A517N9I2_9BACT|nr:CHAD domain-containing protein [Rubripirellula lacrimiformis]QDT03791.1 CHAD domain protein [Rubripirellula lacrimiformis]